MQYYIQRESGLLKDCRLTMSNPFVKPVMQPARNIVLPNLGDLGRDYNRITSSAQYQYKSGRYVLKTGNVNTYQNLEQLFDMDSWLKSIFYARIVYWYSSRKNFSAVYTSSDATDRILLPMPSIPLSTVLSQPSGISMVARQNGGGDQYTLLPANSTNRVVGDSMAVCFVISCAAGFNAPQAIPFINITDSVFDTLSINLIHDNCLQIVYNNTAVIVRMLDPTQKNVIVISAQHIKSVLPKMNIFVNGLLHVDEYLSDTQHVQGLGGASVDLLNNSAVTVNLHELLAFEVPSSESPIDFAFFKTMCEANRLADFFAAEKKCVFTVYPSQQQMAANSTTLFACQSGFSYDATRNIIHLENGSIWWSSMWCFENYMNVSFDIIPHLLVSTQTDTSLLFKLGTLVINLVPSNMTLQVKYGQQVIGTTPSSLSGSSASNVRVEIKKKSRAAPRGIDMSRLVVTVNNIIIAALEDSTISTNLHNAQMRLSNTSAQLSIDLLSFSLQLTKNKDL